MEAQSSRFTPGGHCHCQGEAVVIQQVVVMQHKWMPTAINHQRRRRTTTSPLPPRATLTGLSSSLLCPLELNKTTRGSRAPWGARQYVNKPVTDSWCEADGLESFIHTSSIRVEYYTSFEYCLTWERPMNTRHTSKRSPPGSPNPKEEVIRRRFRGRRQRTGLRKTKASDSVVYTDEGRGHDIIDIISSTHGAEHIAEEDEGKFVEVADEGVEQLDEDCSSVSSSIASGPSLLYSVSPKKPKPLQGVCSACRKLYQKAKKMKAPIKNKLLDNDPKSLTCDQWVLMKNWRPRRLPNARGRLLTHIQLVKKRLQIENKAKRTVERAGETGPSACSRPHTFLQRNLRQPLRAPVKKERKKNRRKRTRDDSQGPRVAKQQRLHSNSHPRHTDIGWTENKGLHPASGHGLGPGFEECKEQEINDPADADRTAEFFPPASTLETTETKQAAHGQRAQKKTCGFRDLLAQLRGNSSMIVRETR